MHCAWHDRQTGDARRATDDARRNTIIIDEFQINEINVDLRTSGFDNEVLSVDACAVWWERESFYCLPRIGVVTWHREPRFQCGSARTGSIWNSSIAPYEYHWEQNVPRLYVNFDEVYENVSLMCALYQYDYPRRHEPAVTHTSLNSRTLVDELVKMKVVVVINTSVKMSFMHYAPGRSS